MIGECKISGGDPSTVASGKGTAVLKKRFSVSEPGSAVRKIDCGEGADPDRKASKGRNLGYRKPNGGEGLGSPEKKKLQHRIHRREHRERLPDV